MPTKTELETKIALDLARKDLSDVTLSQIRDALIAAPSPDQQALRDAVRTRSSQRAGEILVRLTTDFLVTRTAAEATAMLNDDALTLAELSRWLD